jgi:hypothetical protein
MAKIVLETEDCEFTIETTIDFGEGVDATGVTWTRQGPPANLPGERWDSVNGETAWRS